MNEEKIELILNIGSRYITNNEKALILDYIEHLKSKNNIVESKNIELVIEIERLNNKYNKALELLADYNSPCEYDEGKIPDNYCEENCSDDYKKCWDKYIELELKGSGKE